MSSKFRVRTIRGLGAVALLLLCLAALPSATVEAAPRMTRFIPERHSFRFANTFSNDVVKGLDIRTGGLCGGMVYSALDYFNKRRPIPPQDYRPANRTRLQSYIYKRQMNSMLPNLRTWANYGLNVDGNRNRALFERGIDGSRGGELAKLRRLIDRGSPAPLGLKSYGGKVGDEDRPGDHQVLAIGYELGRYRGDKRGQIGDLKLFIYDPNLPQKTMTLVADVGDRSYFYESGDPDVKFGEEWRYRWRAYFVDTSYRPLDPPAVRPVNRTADGRLREVVVEVETGDDDLRGGNDNVDLVLRLRGGATVRQANINLGARWLSNYSEWARVFLPQPVLKSQIQSVELVTNFGGGVGGDNWDARRIFVHFYEAGSRNLLAQRIRLIRFTGRRRSVRIPVMGPPPSGREGLVTRLVLDFGTGGDDLRGNTDNVNVTVLYRDGTEQLQRNVNERRRWADGSEHSARIDLRRPVNPREIVGIRLTTTSRGGVGGDNWNLDHLKIRVYSVGDRLPDYFERRGTPLHRFTGRNRNYTARK